MKKILFVATVSEHFYYFHLPVFKYFHDMGWQVEAACHGDLPLEYCDKRYELPIRRSPFSKDNIIAFKQLKKIIKDNHYDIIHCHTPMGGVLARLAASGERANGTKVLYTAHGFHFYKGAPFINKLIYYPIEYMLSFITDGLITINHEDFYNAEKHLKAKKVFLVNGVGYNSDRFSPALQSEKTLLRNELGFSPDEKILIYVAELNENKNQALLIEAAAMLKGKINFKLLLAGKDNYNGRYQALAANLGVSDVVLFLGHRNDIDKLLKASDLAVCSSLREGLPVNVMEAMACGLPVVLTDNRGHRELVKNGVNGFIVNSKSANETADAVYRLLTDNKLYSEFSDATLSAVKKYSKEYVIEELKEVYKQFI